MTALLLVLLAPGCGDDNPTESPTPKPSPQITTSLQCLGGIIALQVVNSGGTMSDPTVFVAAFEDGHEDTLKLTMDANESMTCQLSNVHGGVTVTNSEWNFEETTDDCLANTLGSLLASLDLSAYVASPAVHQTYALCTYSIYVNDLAADHTTFQMTPTDDGLTLTCVYHGITADLVGTSPGLCPDFTGELAISSITVQTRINISDEATPEITFGGFDATISGLQVNIDGTFGFVVEWITNAFASQFTDAIQHGVEGGITGSLGSELADFIIVNSSCAE